ncbi:hypothetical protein [Hymenobacter convexus]|uniref:hypothetical protein n=1 Tax=Hymenobacter sp. CA1UV-4 TaxID=3063782 RepID=UPI002712CE00|nr:hypothetical protein [Hymenobacter sp. CA1UV-4]MDO7853061.1 hypothetical protein [Hymenobacter sp. CA1UV-4]
MTTFRELLNHPLGIVFIIDKPDGEEEWQPRTGIVVPGTDGLAVCFPPNTAATIQLDPEWEERLSRVPEDMRTHCDADFMIYITIGQLPDDADLNAYSFIGLNIGPQN